MNISGSGALPGGVYDDSIHISGSGKITGNASCTEFHCSGSGRIEGDLMCQNDFRCSGACKVMGALLADSVTISGSCACESTVTVKHAMMVSGAFRSGSVVAGEFRSSGAATVNGDISADLIKSSGRIVCNGLMNGDSIDIRFGGDSSADSVGGSSIQIQPGNSAGGFIRTVVRKLFDKEAGCFKVAGSIEGDEIYLEGVTAETVTGRVVTIGPGCSIGKVFYNEAADISPDANVGAVEQILG